MTIDVVLALDVWPVGEHVTVCSQVHLQEDEVNVVCTCEKYAADNHGHLLFRF